MGRRSQVLCSHMRMQDQGQAGAQKGRALFLGEGAEACKLYGAFKCRQSQQTLPLPLTPIDLWAPKDLVHTTPLTLTLVSLLSYDTPEKKNTTF